jgi:hypothetical protein
VNQPILQRWPVTVPGLVVHGQIVLATGVRAREHRAALAAIGAEHVDPQPDPVTHPRLNLPVSVNAASTIPVSAFWSARPCDLARLIRRRGWGRDGMSDT